MATPLGTTFSTDEQVVAQGDVIYMGKTVESLVVESQLGHVAAPFIFHTHLPIGVDGSNFLANFSTISACSTSSFQV